jgi:hypothetical protein
MTMFESETRAGCLEPEAMVIPEDWLVCLTTPAEAEEEFADEEPSEPWLTKWWSFLSRFTPGDELWEYQGTVYEPLAPESVGGVLEEHGGFALVRDGEVLDSIEAPWLA